MSLRSATRLAAEVDPLAQSILWHAGLHLVWAWEIGRARARGAIIRADALDAARDAAPPIVDESALVAFEREGLCVVDAAVRDAMIPHDWSDDPQRDMPRLGMEVE